jgi:thermitase
MKTLKYSLPFLMIIIGMFFFQNIDQKGDGIYGNLASESPSIASPNSPEIPAYEVTGIQNHSGLVAGKMTSVSISNDPYNFNQWYLKNMQVPDLQPISTSLKEVTVAILDTGIDKYHEDLRDRVKGEIDFTNSFSPADENGHGTHIAGIISSNNDNQIGISGLAPNARLLNVKVVEDNGLCKADVVAKGIYWAIDNGAQVINLSIEFSDPYQELENAINYAWQKDCIVIASASNHTVDPVFPAFYRNCLAVLATDRNNLTGKLGNTKDWIDVAAPGYSIYSTLPGNSYGFKSGTSFGTAQVSGLAAILYGIAMNNYVESRLNDKVRQIILENAQDISLDGIKLINFNNSISSLISER